MSFKIQIIKPGKTFNKTGHIISTGHGYYYVEVEGTIVNLRKNEFITVAQIIDKDVFEAASILVGEKKRRNTM